MTTDRRPDLFTTIHKALRATLFETAALLARTDFASPEEAALAARAVDRAVGLLEEHAGHEDAVVQPAVEALSPELFVAVRDDHARVDGLQRDVAALAARARGASEAERVAIGRRLHDRFGLLVAEHLQHMRREEHEVQRLLLAHRTDEELQALHGRILVRIPPARLAQWLGVLLPAVSGPERAALLAGLAGRA